MYQNKADNDKEWVIYNYHCNRDKQYGGYDNNILLFIKVGINKTTHE